MEHSEKIKLLTVEAAFLIEGRGVLVLPLIPKYEGPMSFSVIVRKPSGEESVVQAQLDIPMLNPPPKHYSFSCSLPRLTKQDVPIGTEIWLFHDPGAQPS